MNVAPVLKRVMKNHEIKALTGAQGQHLHKPLSTTVIRAMGYTTTSESLSHPKL
jgi:hypothetical protein